MQWAPCYTLPNLDLDLYNVTLPEYLDYCYVSGNASSVADDFNNLVSLYTDFCHSVCPQQCHVTTYDVSSSAATWPAISSYKLDELSSYYVLEDNLSLPAKQELVRRDALCVEVFLQTMDVIIYETIPKYDWASFLARVGGVLGLCIGASLVSVIEVLTLLVDLVSLACSKVTRHDDDIKEKPGNHPARAGGRTYNGSVRGTTSQGIGGSRVVNMSTRVSPASSEGNKGVYSSNNGVMTTTQGVNTSTQSGLNKGGNHTFCKSPQTGESDSDTPDLAGRKSNGSYRPSQLHWNY